MAANGRRRGTGRRRGLLARLLLLVFGFAFLALVATPFLVVLAVIEEQPRVVQGAPLDAQQAARATRLINRTGSQVARSRGPTVVRFTESELNSLLALAGRGIERLQAQVRIRSSGLDAAATVRISPTPLGEHVNLGVGVVPSRSGLRISHVTLGRTEVPGWIALPALRLGLDVFLGQGRGSDLLDAVQNVSMGPGRVSVGLIAAPEMGQRLRAAQEGLGEVRDQLALLGDPDTVAVYYGRILELVGEQGSQNVSLAWYMGSLFTLARRRSLTADPVAENRALILAMAMAFGDPRFEAFIGDVRVRQTRARPPRRGGVNLAGRYDLRLHFIISAGLEILAQSGISYAIGEFKELADSGSRRGSGFSFVDLAADRAGVQFAVLATERSSASRVQTVLAGRDDESRFFPDIRGLEEGLRQDEFERRYGGLEAAAYLDVVDRIDRRIAATAIHR